MTEPVVRPAVRGSDYAELSRLVRGAGLLDRRPRYYAIKITVLALLLAVGGAVFALLGDTWFQLLVAVYLAALFGQIGFLGHEAGHQQMFRSRRANDIAGLVHGNLLVGLSYGWWTGKHNRHHAHPNQLGKDPDISIGALAFTPGQAGGKRGPLRAVVRYQAYLFFPLLTLEAVSMHAVSVRAVLGGGVGNRPLRRRWLEGLLLLGHCAGYLTLVALVLSPLRTIAFIAVQQGLFGVYLGCAFAPNHKGMPVLGEQDQLDSSAARCSPHATSPAGGRWKPCSAGSTTRSSTTCSRPCPGPACVTAGSWSAPTAPSAASPTPKPAWPPATPKSSAPCTPPRAKPVPPRLPPLITVIPGPPHDHGHPGPPHDHGHPGPPHDHGQYVSGRNQD